MIHAERSTLVPRQVTHWQVVCEQCDEVICRSHYHGHGCAAAYHGKDYLGDYLCSDECWEQYKQERGLDR